ncbi:MAG TPA: hypothetical protein VNC84_05530 [Gammaproteobacteria bacterium]|jgi:hypothetical protein|nr:hypothetical protein [Gammaproteobacteria bacterium]
MLNRNGNAVQPAMGDITGNVGQLVNILTGGDPNNDERFTTNAIMNRITQAANSEPWNASDTPVPDGVHYHQSNVLVENRLRKLIASAHKEKVSADERIEKDTSLRLAQKGERRRVLHNYLPHVERNFCNPLITQTKEHAKAFHAFVAASPQGNPPPPDQTAYQTAHADLLTTYGRLQAELKQLEKVADTLGGHPEYALALICAIATTMMLALLIIAIIALASPTAPAALSAIATFGMVGTEAEVTANLIVALVGHAAAFLVFFTNTCIHASKKGSCAIAHDTLNHVKRDATSMQKYAGRLWNNNERSHSTTAPVSPKPSGG